MAADKLIVDEIGNAWRVCWWLYEEGEQGAVLGEKLYTQAELDDTKEQADRDHLAASLAVQALKPERDSEWSSFYWESQAGAKKALAVANAAIKADRLRGKKEHRDWPEWALTALANKWRPPQNWKP